MLQSMQWQRVDLATEEQLSNYFFKKGNLERGVLIPSKGVFHYASCCYE